MVFCSVFGALVLGFMVLSVFGGGGCAAAGKQMTASNREYLAYRTVRTSDRLDQRLFAAHNYLVQYPDGRWVAEVQPWYEQTEQQYWALLKSSKEGISRYLQALPMGLHAPQATAALAVYQERENAKRRELLEIQAANTEERLAMLAEQRQRAHDLFTSWLVRWLGITTWQHPTSWLDHNVLFEWRIAPPQAKCIDDRCAKLIEQPYEIAGGGDHALRMLLMDAVLMLHNGVVNEARLEGPGLFSRLFEATNQRSLNINPLALRIEAIAYVISLVGGAIEAKMPRERCNREPVSPVVLDRSCDGWTVKVIVADQPDQDDVVSIVGPGDDVGRDGV